MAVHDDGVGFGLAVQAGAAGAAAEHKCGRWWAFELLSVKQHHQVFAGCIGVTQVESYG